MKSTNRLLLLAAIFVLALPLVFTGTASAKYQSDGALENGTTGGWISPDDGICVLALHPDGTMDVDATIHTSRDCQARLVSVTAVTPNDTLANVCAKSGSNTAGFKYATPGGSTCVTVDSGKYISGSISLVNRDRNTQMCTGLGGVGMANAGAGIVKLNANGTAAQCIAYGWQYRGMDSNVNDAGYGQPLAFGTKGVDNTVTPTTQAGFCYTSMRTTLAVASCPTVPGSASGTGTANASTAFGYSVSGAYCLYAYGITGTLNAALTDVTGNTATINSVLAAAGASIDLSTNYTTQGACLANGGTWSNWIPIGSTATVGALNGITTAVTFDLTRQLVNSDEGCLHCHSTLVQANGDVYRQKDSYLQTGHKNMLRKVTPGMVWAGPNASGVLTIYTTDGTHALNWGTFGTPNSALDGSNPMYYIYGDWMIANPTVAIAGSNYACANCHSAGFSGGTGATPGVQSIGTPGYTGTQPLDAGAAYVSAVKAGYKWDLEGIQCARCHNAAGPSVTQTMISGGTCKGGKCSNTALDVSDVTSKYPTSALCTAAGYTWSAGPTDETALYPTLAACTTGLYAGTWTAIGTASSFPTTHPTSAGMGSLASGPGINNLCFGCHQSIAKSWPSGAAQYDPTVIPVGVSHGAAAGRDFNGHVLGNSFLNSAHARYAGAQTGNGSITANSLGENDLTDPNGLSEYNSIFKGYTCFQGPQPNNDVALTDASGNPLTKVSCNSIYGAGSWAVDTNGAQGTCTTCHDVHNSLFVATQRAAAIKKICADCHVNNATTGDTDALAPQVVLATTAHPQTAGTPFDATKYDDPCVVCHMATQAEANGDQTSMPAHLWRINPSATYNTFPSVGQFYGGTCTVHTGAIQNAPQSLVVYLSDTTSAACTAASGSWTPVAETRNATASPETVTTGSGGTYANAVWVDLDLACGQCHVGSGVLGANGAPVFTKTELSAAATGIHTGLNAGTSNANCLTCHTTGDGGAPVITTTTAGKNHHGAYVGCTICHPTPHVGAMPSTKGEAGTLTSVSYSGGPGGNAFCMQCHSNTLATGGHGTHHVTTAVATAGLACSTCHSVVVGSPGTEGYAGVTPVWTNLRSSDCEACHSNYAFGTSTNASISPPITIEIITPGTNHHGAFAWCTDCHYAEPMSPVASNTGITEGGPTSGGPGTAPSVTYVDGSTSGNAFCMNCHTNSGSYGTHHVTAELATAGQICTNCHSVKAAASSMGYFAGVRPTYSAVTNADCLQCHSSDLGNSTTTAISPAIDIAPITPGTNHHGTTPGDCVACHTAEPETPLPAETNAVCATCHTAENVATMNHPQAAMFTALTCSGCHNYNGTYGQTFEGVNPGIIPCHQCHAAGQVWPLTDAALTARANGIHQALPDLVVLNTYVTPTTVAPSGSVSITDVTVNQSVSGTAGASTTAFYVVSACTTAPSGSPAALRAVPSLGPGANNSATTSVPMPGTAGTYYIVANANNSGSVTESNTNNNTKCSGAITVTGALPDLYIAAVAAPASATHSTSISLSDRTSNQGGSTAGVSTTTVYLNSSCAVGGTVLKARAVPVLVPGGGNLATYSVTLPAGTGTKTLVWMADSANVVTESNEGNNTYCKTITIN